MIDALCVLLILISDQEVTERESYREGRRILDDQVDDILDK